MASSVHNPSPKVTNILNLRKAMMKLYKPIFIIGHEILSIHRFLRAHLVYDPIFDPLADLLNVKNLNLNNWGSVKIHNPVDVAREKWARIMKQFLSKCSNDVERELVKRLREDALSDGDAINEIKAAMRMLDDVILKVDRLYLVVKDIIRGATYLGGPRPTPMP